MAAVVLNEGEVPVCSDLKYRVKPDSRTPLETRKTMPLRRVIVWLLLIILSSWIVARTSALIESKVLGADDFVQYWAAGRVLMQGGNPYGETDLMRLQRSVGWAGTDALMMWNPPSTFPLILPFALLPYPQARALWLIVHLIFLVVSAGCLWRLNGGTDSSRWIAYIGAVSFVPAVWTLALGQISILSLAGIVAFVWCVNTQRDMLGGSAMLLIAAKPHLFPLFWLFLLLWITKEGRWRVFAGGAIAIVSSLGLSALLNPSAITEYLIAVRSSSGPMLWQVPTWGIVLRHVFPQSGWVQFLPAFVGMLFGIYIWRRWQGILDWKRQIPLIVLISIICSPFSWPYDWVVLLPVVVFILMRFQADALRNWWLLAGLIVVEFAPIVQNLMKLNALFDVCVPLAFAALYFLEPMAYRPTVKESSDSGRL